MVFQHSIQKQCSAIICELIGRVEAGFSIQYLRGREAMLLWKEQVLVCDVWIDLKEFMGLAHLFAIKELKAH